MGDPDTECPICYDPIKVHGVLSCKHEFCFSCILQWSQQSNTCPLCKERFTQVRKATLRVRDEWYEFLTYKETRKRIRLENDEVEELTPMPKRLRTHEIVKVPHRDIQPYRPPAGQVAPHFAQLAGTRHLLLQLFHAPSLPQLPLPQPRSQQPPPQGLAVASGGVIDLTHDDVIVRRPPVIDLDVIVLD